MKQTVLMTINVKPSKLVLVLLPQVQHDPVKFFGCACVKTLEPRLQTNLEGRWLPQQKKPVLVQLDIDSIEGGTSPWFSGMGRMFVAMVTTDPENADLFGQLASEGSMATLVSYLDMEQAMVSFIALLCYIVLGLTLLSLFVVLPVAAFALRRHTAGVGLVQVPDVRAGPWSVVAWFNSFVS
ncbi:hypothetical protein MRX96_024279 [Rhipicephalus microplus]